MGDASDSTADNCCRADQGVQIQCSISTAASTDGCTPPQPKLTIPCGTGEGLFKKPGIRCPAFFVFGDRRLGESGYQPTPLPAETRAGWRIRGSRPCISRRTSIAGLWLWASTTQHDGRDPPCELAGRQPAHVFDDFSDPVSVRSDIFFPKIEWATSIISV